MTIPNRLLTCFAAFLLTAGLLHAQENGNTRSLGSGAHGPVPPGRWVQAINDGQPKAVVMTRGALRNRVDLDALADVVDGPAWRFQASAALSPWQFLVIKNVLDVADHKPQLVILLTQDDLITRPDKGVTQDYAIQIDALHGRHNRGAQYRRRAGSMFMDYVVEPELQTLSYPNNPLPHSIDNSFLPHMVQIAAENGFRLAVVRERAHGVTDEQAEREYVDSLRQYLDREGLAYIEAGDGVIDALRDLMNQSPPRPLDEQPVLPAGEAFTPQPPDWDDEPNPESDDQLARGLIGHWRLDGTRGRRAVDSGPHQLHGLMHGRMTYQDNAAGDGPVGQALNFDGIDQTIEIRGEQFARLPQLTVSIWVNWHGVNAGNTYQTLIGDYHFYRGIFIYTGRDGAPVFGSYHEVDDDPRPRRQNLNWQHQLETGQWTHLAAVFDGQTKITYVNGEETNRTSHSGDVIGAGGLFLGWNVNVYYFRGQMDDARLYDRALSPEEIARLHQMRR